MPVQASLCPDCQQNSAHTSLENRIWASTALLSDLVGFPVSKWACLSTQDPRTGMPETCLLPRVRGLPLQTFSSLQSFPGCRSQPSAFFSVLPDDMEISLAALGVQEFFCQFLVGFPWELFHTSVYFWCVVLEINSMFSYSTILVPLLRCIFLIGFRMCPSL